MAFGWGFEIILGNMKAGCWTPWIAFLLIGCPAPSPHPTKTPDPEAVERDEIYQFLAYAIAFKDWQSQSTNPRRGHNIAAVLVNPEGKIVASGRNCNTLAKDTTQHAELRAMRGYLATSQAGTLKGFTIYTTLEPCAMCAGMMIQAEVQRVVYGQSDPEFGKALDRLAIDTRERADGFPPYPRKVLSEPSSSSLRLRLDEAYRKNPYPSIEGGLVGWLRSEEANAHFQEAFRRFDQYEPRHDANRSVLREAREFYQAIPK
jgi:tRNA(Arg) A34 adenosine deaminase TadA